MLKRSVDNIMYMQARYNEFKRVLYKTGAQSITQAYVKPSAAKRAAWERIYNEYHAKQNEGTLTVISAGCQNFTVGLMTLDIFVYINKSYTVYWKVVDDKLVYKETAYNYNIACARRALNELKSARINNIGKGGED